ncbi:hypothetical protein C2G38_2182416 [Gigaspora rosea]|uniref:Uncharacterized protein n=1 Tax=Gigaspora rosea TaxID=44941 RepID=A0A397VE37_9GLOM|nr:hypothetical protein C2G38_2182416 [Gigaspora rosea]
MANGFDAIHSENERHVYFSNPLINKIVPGEHILYGYNTRSSSWDLKEITEIIRYDNPTEDRVYGYVTFEGNITAKGNVRRKIKRDKYRKFFCEYYNIRYRPYKKKFIYDKWRRICDYCMKFVSVTEYEVVNKKCKDDEYCPWFNSMDDKFHHHKLCSSCKEIKDGNEVDPLY